MERLFETEPQARPRDQGRPTTSVEPLAARMRPRSLDELVGHAAVVGRGTPLRTMLERGEVTSMILWGPPGSGKTSLARVVAAHVEAAWQELSAVSAGVKDVRAVLEQARSRLDVSQRRTVLFLDEIHRFNKAQQDALLPGVEAGTIVLIGATTENPFFELNAPLLSRCRLVRLDPLTDDDVRAIVRAAVDDPQRGLGGRIAVTDEAVDVLVSAGDGDARAALNTLELAVRALADRGASGGGPEHDPDQDPGPDADAARRPLLDGETVGAGIATMRYDRGDAHYDQTSAFIKSLRGSDPDAAVYWLVRMLTAGEDPLFLARRMVILASEDVGMADPNALPTAVAAFDAVARVGLPEAEFALAHAAVALATADKSDAVTRALGEAKRLVERHGNAPVPLHLRDAHSRAGRALGHGTDYDYPHDHPGGWVAQRYLPDALGNARLYRPTTHGAERDVAERLAARRAAPNS
jgi:putative ATPase